MTTFAPLILGGTALLTGSHTLAARLFQAHRPGRDRICAAAVLAPLAAISIVVLLGVASAIARGPVLITSIAVGTIAVLASGPTARSLAWRDLQHSWVVIKHAALLYPGSGLWVGVTALAAAMLAAYLLPILPMLGYDQFGYHLPFVYDALQTGTLRTVPTHVFYVNAYSHALELYFVWLRALLPDDGLLDAAQVPFGLSAVVAVASLAARHGVPSPRALSLAALFLALPVVALQLATDYVDIGFNALVLLSVYWVTGLLDRASCVIAALALGLLLGSKPIAPVSTALILGVVGWRTLRAGVPRRAVAVALLAFGLGGAKYVSNFIARHNPLWPAAFQIGRLVVLPGIVPAEHFFHHWVPDWFRQLGWIRRALVSWYIWPSNYIADMPVGGLGPLHAFGLLPLAAPCFVRRADRAAVKSLVLVAASVLFTPVAYWARFVLALPGALLAAAAVTTEQWPVPARRASDLFLSVLGAWGLWLAFPYFTGGHSSLMTLLQASSVQRTLAVGVDKNEANWVAARARIRIGEAFGYDSSFGLPGQVWCPDGRRRVVYLSDDVQRPEQLLAWIHHERVRMVVLSDSMDRTKAAVREYASRFRALFHCPYDACTVFEVMAP